MFFISFLMIFITIPSLGCGFDYCKLTCTVHSKLIHHTMCVYRKGGVNCNDWHSVMRNDMIKTLEDRHNELRQLVAVNEQSRYCKGPIRNMMRMKWSDDLAATAQRWADQCEQHGPDECRISWDHVKTDQLIEEGYWSVEKGPTPYEIKIINSLFDNYKTKLSDKKCNKEELLIPNADRFGCGYIQKSTPDGGGHDQMVSYKLVCNYHGRVGSAEARALDNGPPCSACPPNSRCDAKSKFPNLCTPENLINDQSSVTFCDPDDKYAKKYKIEHPNSGGSICVSLYVLNFSLFTLFVTISISVW